MKTNNFSSPTERDVLKGKVGYEMGLKIAIDSHSNIASDNKLRWKCLPSVHRKPK